LKAESLLKIVAASAFFVSTMCFNVPNHPIFGQPDTSPGSPTYGVIGGTPVDAREVQLALKLVF
jgi:hypothetical protein